VLERSSVSNPLVYNIVLAVFAFGQNSCFFLTKAKKVFAFLSVFSIASYDFIIGTKIKVTFVSKLN
jgi:hypothetical protein